MQTHEYTTVVCGQDNLKFTSNHYAENGWRVVSFCKDVYSSTTLTLLLERPYNNQSDIARDLSNHNI